MRRNIKNNDKKENLKNFSLFLLIIIIFILIIMWLLKVNGSTKSKQVITDLINAQILISEYIGKTKSETFDIYTTEEILIGITEKDKSVENNIKDNDEKEILQIADMKDKIEKNNVSYYKINLKSVGTEFGIKLYDDKNINWYIKETGEIKVDYKSKPHWWSKELDTIYIYN